jgi:ABC-type uncharacterized transport system auxiliary subunit
MMLCEEGGQLIKHDYQLVIDIQMFRSERRE